MIMESSLPSYGDELPRDELSRTYSLELAYQETIKTLEFIIQDEVMRRLRLRILLLEDENDELHEQLATEDGRIDELEQDCVELERQVEQAETTSRQYENELRMKARELNGMKAELSSMNHLSIDSTKLLTEKLSLARELAILKPELDHLRSQASYQQTLLAEKLALQRQVSTLEVELETQKRALQRVNDREKENDDDSGLHREVQELRKDLFKERREKEKALKAGDKGFNQWESRKAVLENKVEELRMKLRESKELVKKLESNLTQAQVAATKVSTTTHDQDTIRIARKRAAVQMSTDSMIGTPDGVAVRGKRHKATGKVDQTLLAEKSTFSITPYLNRTLNIESETPKYGPKSAANEEHEAQANGQIPAIEQSPLVAEKDSPCKSNKAPKLAVVQPKHGKKNTKAIEKSKLTEAKSGTINAKVPQKKPRMVKTLEKVTEEDVDENAEPISTPATLISTKPSWQVQATVTEEVEPKKKRKLLGTAKTLFDEDDSEASKRPAKVILGPPRSLVKGQLIGQKSGALGGLAGGFCAFSPLKKDKRGSQSSFLA